MNQRQKRIVSVILCLLLILGSYSEDTLHGHMLGGFGHTEADTDHGDHDHEGAGLVFDDHDHEDEAVVYEDHNHKDEALVYDEHAHNEQEKVDFLPSLTDILESVQSMFVIRAYAGYEDGVECEYCGGWRYDDWKCDNGDHCGEGADGDCYEEHHCGYCGSCEEDNELCDDCGNCLEDHCECDDKCRGCYEQGGTICSECGEKCTECAEWICDECEKCPDCSGNEAYCSYCDICLGCAEWICYCGDGCSRCAIACEGCYEKCTNCEPDALCSKCSYCVDCMGGDENFCETCQLCIDCVDAICICGNGCSECVLVCEDCGENFLHGNASK